MQAKWTSFALPPTGVSIPAVSVKALRGANQASANEAAAIRTATAELMTELMARNSLRPEDLISCLFTVTEDLDAEFPAAAAREIGLDGVPLMCAREIPVPGSLERAVRVLVHYEAPAEAKQVHVYLGGAQALRPDLNSAQ
jgi:chorismate mutase